MSPAALTAAVHADLAEYDYSEAEVENLVLEALAREGWLDTEGQLADDLDEAEREAAQIDVYASRILALEAA